jgi:hypothetical protein
MTWVVVIGSGWLLLATLIAMLIGRSVRLADARAAADAVQPNFVVDPEAPDAPSGATVLPFRTPVSEAAPSPARHRNVDPPTLPGIPVARPQVPGAQKSGGRSDPIRHTGLA